MSNSPNTLVETLYSHKPGLLRFLHQRLGCEEAAHDVFQNLSENLIAKPVGAEVENPKAYLYRAAANAAHSHQRFADTRSRYEAAAAGRVDETDVSNPERDLLGKDAIMVAQKALNELPLLTRRMFIAFRVNGETQCDIARRFGVSLSTVEKRIAKATTHCHRKLRDSGVTEYRSGARHSNDASKIYREKK